jgi:phospholipid transport system substrate-binding protein
MSRYVKRTITVSFLAALALSASLANAQPYGGNPGWNTQPQMNDGAYGAPWGQQTDQNSPSALLRDGVERLTRVLQSRPSRGALTSFIDTEIAPWFDFDFMAASAAGRRFQYMNDAQQDEVAARIKHNFLDRMVQKLAQYSSQRAAFLPARPDGPGQMTLPVAIENQGGYPSQLEFHMRLTENGWRVVDVSANGMSALLHYRQNFNELMGQRPQGRY